MSKKMMGQIMRQAQQMQEQMARVQEQAGSREVSAAAGGGMVTVTANGRQEITRIVISPQVVDPNDVEMLQDLILAATVEAQRQAREQMEAEMSKVTGGLNLPGMGGGGNKSPLSGLF
ncbi:MAG: YbaB/EbfC family nucleoid-associated protein [Nitrospirota bacterium]|nr:YbaB/EbfC family nucleoid-associated protein [Nitrospirota bacterium]